MYYNKNQTTNKNNTSSSSSSSSSYYYYYYYYYYNINPLNAELNPIRHLLAQAGAHHFVDVSRIRVNYYCYCYHY
jgi:uncharacterized membrane protein